MIVVAGTVTFDPSSQERVIEGATRVANATRLEDGCLRYEFFADLARPGRLHVFEEWEEEQHLIAHLETQHLADFRVVLQSAGVQTRDINRYFVSAVVPN